MNPFFLCYGDTVSQNVADFAGPSAIFVTGRSNRDNILFQQARAKGAEVYPYFNLIERRISRVSSVDAEFYMGDYSAPLWGSGRLGYQNKTYLLDIRVGSDWIKYAVDYLAGIIRSKRSDGFFLDVIGGNLWMSDFSNWPIGEQQEWRAGAVDAVRLIREMINAENPNFVVVNNNHWQHKPEGANYVNGIVIENPKPELTDFFKIYAAKPYGIPAKRRVLVIARDDVTAEAWETAPGVTHVATTHGSYANPGVSLTPYEDLRFKELEIYIQSLKDRIADLIIENSLTTDELHKAETAYNSTLIKLQQTQDNLDKATRRISAGISALTV